MAETDERRLDNLHYMLDRVGTLTTLMAAMMSEVDLEALDADLVVAFNEMGRGVFVFMRQLIREAEGMGFKMPPHVLSFMNEIEEVIGDE